MNFKVIVKNCLEARYDRELVEKGEIAGICPFARRDIVRRLLSCSGTSSICNRPFAQIRSEGSPILCPLRQGHHSMLIGGGGSIHLEEVVINLLVLATPNAHELVPGIVEEITRSMGIYLVTCESDPDQLLHAKMSLATHVTFVNKAGESLIPWAKAAYLLALSHALAEEKLPKVLNPSAESATALDCLMLTESTEEFIRRPTSEIVKTFSNAVCEE